MSQLRTELNISGVKPVLRRSHAKSKNGCHTCRARRIKCDELRPYCRNCSYSRRACKYPIHSNADATSMPASSTIAESHLKTWKDSGKPPFPFLNLPITPTWHNLSLTDLRHMHHLGVMASVLEISKTREFCLYWSEFQTFIKLALRFDFVRYCIAAHSAERFAHVAKTSAAFQDAVRYREMATRGLNQAISSFSKENADAILCASLSLSNQQPTWRSWKTMLDGISTVIREMRLWISDSMFSRYIVLEYGSSSGIQVESIGEIQSVGKGCLCFDSTLESLLTQGVASLNTLSNCTKGTPDLSALIRQLRDALRTVLERPSDWPVAEQFRLVHPFASWMDEHTLSYFAISERDSVALVSLAHFYAVVVALGMALPEIHLPMVISIRLNSISKLGKILEGVSKFFCSSCRADHSHDGLMKFPLDTVHKFYQLRGYETPS